MFRILTEKIISKNDSSGLAESEADMVVSSSGDLPGYDEVAGRILVPGSIAVVPTESKLFVLGLDNEWKEWAP